MNEALSDSKKRGPEQGQGGAPVKRSISDRLSARVLPETVAAFQSAAAAKGMSMADYLDWLAARLPSSQ